MSYVDILGLIAIGSLLERIFQLLSKTLKIDRDDDDKPRRLRR